MAKEGSVAPKERINIVYKPATGNAQAEIELPLKMMVLGDFTGRADSTPLEERKAINIDKDNFNDVMRAHNLAVDINVKNTLSGAEGDEMSTSLKFGTLKDFEPEAVANQVPELKNMLELRAALVGLRSPLGNVPAFKKKLEKIMGDEAAKNKLLGELGANKKEGE